jgi:hypothetical protein
MTSLLNFIKIYKLAQKILEGGGTQTNKDRQKRTQRLSSLRSASNKINWIHYNKKIK